MSKLNGYERLWIMVEIVPASGHAGKENCLLKVFPAYSAIEINHGSGRDSFKRFSGEIANSG